MGTMTSAMHPRSVDAQRGFSVSYICVAKSGNAAPNNDRTTVIADSALAATARYASIVSDWFVAWLLSGTGALIGNWRRLRIARKSPGRQYKDGQ